MTIFVSGELLSLIPVDRAAYHFDHSNRISVRFTTNHWHNCCCGVAKLIKNAPGSVLLDMINGVYRYPSTDSK